MNNRIKPALSTNAIHKSTVFTIERSYPVIVISSSSPTFKTAVVFAGKGFEVGKDDLDSFPEAKKKLNLREKNESINTSQKIKMMQYLVVRVKRKMANVGSFLSLYHAKYKVCIFL